MSKNFKKIVLETKHYFNILKPHTNLIEQTSRINFFFSEENSWMSHLCLNPLITDSTFPLTFFTLTYFIQLSNLNWLQSTLCSALTLISINLINYRIIWQAKGYTNLALTELAKACLAFIMTTWKYPSARAICVASRADDFTYRAFY